MAAQGFTGDAFAGITGDLIDGRFSEKSGGGVERQNTRMLRVRVTEPFMARQGSMVAYQGDVSFNYQGGGAAKFLKKAFTGEGLSLMRVEGSGDVFLADQGHHVHILHLHDTGISINGSSVLAFSAGLDWNIERVKGGSIATGGLFNTTLRGTGWVAITTDGEPVVLNAGEAADLRRHRRDRRLVGAPADQPALHHVGRGPHRSRLRRGAPGHLRGPGVRDRAAVRGRRRCPRTATEPHRGSASRRTWSSSPRRSHAPDVGSPASLGPWNAP